jgi:hypothetical protein
MKGGLAEEKPSNSSERVNTLSRYIAIMSFYFYYSLIATVKFLCQHLCNSSKIFSEKNRLDRDPE